MTAIESPHRYSPENQSFNHTVPFHVLAMSEKYFHHGRADVELEFRNFCHFSSFFKNWWPICLQWICLKIIMLKYRAKRAISETNDLIIIIFIKLCFSCLSLKFKMRERRGIASALNAHRAVICVKTVEFAVYFQMRQFSEKVLCEFKLKTRII